VLDAIVAKALAKDQADRFQSADEFRVALDIAVAPVPALPPLAQSIAHKSNQDTVVMPAATAPAAKRRLPHFHVSRMAIVMGIAPALLLAAGFVAVRQRANARRATPAASRQAAPVAIPQSEPTQPAVDAAAQSAPAIPPPAAAAAFSAPATATARSLPVVSTPATLPLAPAPTATAIQRPAAVTRPRQTTPQERRYALQVTGAEVLPAGASGSPAHASGAAEAPASSPGASQPVIVEPPAPHPAAVAPATVVPALEAPSQDVAPAKPQKRNGIVRALGKINPFKKDEPAVSAQPAAKKN
jgi:hypothetical protein